MPNAVDRPADRAARVSAMLAVFGPLALIGAGVATMPSWPSVACAVVGALLFASVWRASSGRVNP